MGCGKSKAVQVKDRSKAEEDLKRSQLQTQPQFTGHKEPAPHLLN